MIANYPVMDHVFVFPPQKMAGVCAEKQMITWSFVLSQKPVAASQCDAVAAWALVNPITVPHFILVPL